MLWRVREFFFVCLSTLSGGGVDSAVLAIDVGVGDNLDYGAYFWFLIRCSPLVLTKP